MSVEAGESFEVEVEFNWEREGITKDWTLTVWGEKGAVTVEHTNPDLTSESFPYTPKSDQAAKTDEPQHSSRWDIPKLQIPVMEDEV